MSETTTPAAGGENSEASLFDDIGQELEAEGNIVPRTEAEDDPEDNPDPEQEQEDDSEKITLKVNGKSVQKTMKEVIELAQKYSATEMKLETAKKEITEARAIKEKYTTQSGAIKDLLDVMKNGNIDMIHDFVDQRLGASQAWNKGVIDYVLKLWEQSKYTPEQKEAHENKKQLARMQQEHEERVKADAERAQQYQINQWTQHLDVEVPKALKEIGLPDSEFVRGHVLSTWRAALERGQTPTALAVANYVKSQLEASKLNYQGQPSRIAAMPSQPRPKATAESVSRRNGTAQPKETGYSSWDDWIRTRGK